MTVEQGEGFAARWSRRKKEVATEGEVQVEEKELAEKEQEELIINEEVKAEDLAKEKLEKLNSLTDEDMPDVETLNEGSDYSGFMSSGVSEALRKMALQKLFHGKSYNIRDGLDEYDGDYTSFEKLDPSVITCDMKHILEVEAEKLLAEEKAKEEEERLLAEDDQIENGKEEEEGESGEQKVADSKDHNAENSDAGNPENLGEENQEESLASKKEGDNQEGDIDKPSKIIGVKGESMAEINDVDEMDDLDGFDGFDDVEGEEV